MKAKKVLALALSMAMLASMVVGCGSTGGGETAGGDAAADDATVYTLKVGHDHTTTSPFQTVMEQFEKDVEEKSGGRIDVEIYPAQQLGSAREMIEMEQAGTLEATLLPTAKFGGFDQRLNLADMPYLASSEQAFIDLMNGEIGQEAMSGLPEIGIQGISFFPEGYKYITNNVKPITSPDDLKGLKIRTMEAPIIMAMFEAWGANPVPIDFSEVYNSLQQGVVDGQENPLLSIHDMKFYEVQKYMTIDTHAFLSYFFSFSATWFNSLPEDLQDLLKEEVATASVNCTAIMQEANAGYLKTIEESGVEVYTLSDEESQAFKDACQKVYDDNRDVIGADLLDRAVEESAKLSK